MLNFLNTLNFSILVLLCFSHVYLSALLKCEQPSCLIHYFDFISQNVELQVQVKKLKKELIEKNKLLVSAK